MSDADKRAGFEWKAACVWALRIIIGVVFIVSGMAKCIDIYGFVFKIEEYFAVWGMSVPRSLTIVGAITISAGEFILGLSLLVGAYRRVSVILLLAQMAVMTPLTLYLWIADPISDCGCFGDFIKLSNGATFFKNLVITAALIWLLPVNKRVKGVYNPNIQWAVAIVSLIFCIVVSLYGLVVQPLVDFRSFPVGSRLVTDDEYDTESIKYVYEKSGERKEFDLTNLPDSTWTFVERVAPEPTGRTELALYDEDGDNVTAEVIHSEGPQLLIVIPTESRADLSDTYFVNELQSRGSFEEGQIVELILSRGKAVERWSDRSMADLPIYSAEETQLKELSRGDMSAVYLQDGVIQWKRSLPSIDIDAISQSEAGLAIYSRQQSVTFLGLSLIFVASLVVLFIIDMSWKLIMQKKSRKRGNVDEKR